MNEFWLGVRRGVVLAWLFGGPALVVAGFVFAARGLAPPWVCVAMALIGTVGFVLADLMSVR